MEIINEIVGKNLQIYQDSEFFKFSLESVLLPNFVEIRLRDKKIIDLCSGNCPIPLILSNKTKLPIIGVEIQKEVYDLGIKSIKLNHKEDQITLLNEDVLNLNNIFSGDTFDLITVNPPYFKNLDTSLKNKNNVKTIARHENNLTLSKLLKISSYLLKENGNFYMVHRTERLIEILNELKKYNLTPKKIQFIYPNINRESKLFMIKATKGGKDGIKVIDGIYIHNEDGSYREEIKEIFK